MMEKEKTRIAQICLDVLLSSGDCNSSVRLCLCRANIEQLKSNGRTHSCSSRDALGKLVSCPLWGWVLSEAKSTKPIFKLNHNNWFWWCEAPSTATVWGQQCGTNVTQNDDKNSNGIHSKQIHYCNNFNNSHKWGGVPKMDSKWIPWDRCQSSQSWNPLWLVPFSLHRIRAPSINLAPIFTWHKASGRFP